MQLRLVAPDMDLLQPAAPPAARPVPPPADVLAQLMKLRDEMTQSASNGRFCDAASREWRRLPVMWRVALLMIAGIGADVEHLYTLADRNWQELPPPEREELRMVVRDAKKHLGGLTALAARV
ncbi:hypothetical protein [Paenacidovorax monticola]|uniref:Uncharacterized protein n=1 Tax=Paenacidovorax monticola TaxID=1926868 RepID=A0A7H0HFZ3_9BURK|nr:hypothetical protein [Paenacidovorax monticola]QNP59459.1 hypothetical protein H9L24_22185 [Paenacidovorax monticola]